MLHVIKDIHFNTEEGAVTRINLIFDIVMPVFKSDDKSVFFTRMHHLT